MVRLGVNVDHIATIREARKTYEPDPVSAAAAAEMAGADQITIHLREDRRHIQNRDARLIREVVHAALNLEMAMTPEMREIALALHPDSVTMVPEKREEVTTEGGLNLKGAAPQAAEIVKTLKDARIKVAAFLDPDLEQIREADRLHFDAIEIHTGAYANAAASAVERELAAVRDAAMAVKRLGMAVHAGHGLNYHNVTPILGIHEIEELNIGHAIIARAVFTGFDRAVRDMLRIMGRV
jgi:pyridoxine 5-phosphate synthase